MLNFRKKQGFTLIELMVVVAIIGILAAIAIPSYRESVVKSRRTDAQGALMSLANVMERHFTESSTYCDFAKSTGGTAVSGCGDAGEDSGTPSQGPGQSPDSGTKAYDLTITVSDSNTYTLRATPDANGPQAGNGYLELTSTGVRNWDKNHNNSIDSGENKWE